MTVSNSFPSKSILNGLVFSAMVSVTISCKTNKPATVVNVPEKPSLLQVGNEKISADEFLQSFAKNRIGADSAEALNIAEYFNLYTNLKLKVQAAKKEGNDTIRDFREEIASYQDVLARGYTADKAIVEDEVKKTYERFKEERNVAHLLLALSEAASPADTLKTYNAALDLRKKILGGASFEEIAIKNSEDPATAKQGGALGFIRPLSMVYPFEVTAFSLPKGGVSLPVRTSFGYHLIKVSDIRPSKGTVRVSQLFLAYPEKATAAQKQQVKESIGTIYRQLQNGESWEKLVEQYSSDLQSKQTGGALQPFGVGKMEPAFETAAFALTKPRTISEPVETAKGWHILRLIEKKPLESYEEMAPQLRLKVVTDTRKVAIDAKHAALLKTKLNIVEYPELQARLKAGVDSSILLGKWKASADLLAANKSVPLFLINQQVFPAGEFLEYAQLRQKSVRAGGSKETALQNLYTNYLNRSLFTYERTHLEENNTDFKNLMNEIRDGVLLSSMMEKNVWGKSVSDTIGQQKVYRDSVGKYRYPERAWIRIVEARDTSVLNQVKAILEKSPYTLQKKSDEILFDNNSAELTAAYRAKLLGTVATLLRNPDYQVTVSGFRAKTEKDSLSAARLATVVKYLINNNISPDRIKEKDNRDLTPVTPAERNRRISFEFFSNSVQDVENALNQQNVQNVVKISDGYFSKENPVVRGISWTTGTQLLTRNSKPTLYIVTRIEPARNKTLNEARGAVINDYQKILEASWLESLKKQYPIKVDQQEWEKLIR